MNIPMEIERKYLIAKLPDNLEQYDYKDIEQGYLNTDPVVRIRRSGEKYTLTYKGSGLMMREEYNLLLNEEAYYHLREKVDGRIIKKRRYLIPYQMGENEFETREAANSFVPPDWFGEDVTFSMTYHNSNLSRL